MRYFTFLVEHEHHKTAVWRLNDDGTIDFKTADSDYGPSSFTSLEDLLGPDETDIEQGLMVEL